jgi:hypothetical protein
MTGDRYPVLHIGENGCGQPGYYVPYPVPRQTDPVTRTQFTRLDGSLMWPNATSPVFGPLCDSCGEPMRDPVNDLLNALREGRVSDYHVLRAQPVQVDDGWDLFQAIRVGKWLERRRDAVQVGSSEALDVRQPPEDGEEVVKALEA